MIKIQTKPQELKAWLWTESKALFKEIGCVAMSSEGHMGEPDLMKELKIETVQGGEKVRNGNYIIQNPWGKYFVVDKFYFETNYNVITT